MMVFALVLAADVAWRSFSSGAGESARVADSKGSRYGQDDWLRTWTHDHCGPSVGRHLAGLPSYLPSGSIQLHSHRERQSGPGGGHDRGARCRNNVFSPETTRESATDPPSSTLGAAVGAVLAQLAPTSSLERIASIVAGDERIGRYPVGPVSNCRRRPIREPVRNRVGSVSRSS